MRPLAATVVLLLAARGDAFAHRLDEYLQATRVSIARHQLTLEVDLTPGVSIAAAVVESLDADADHTIAPAEAEAYGRAVLSDLLVEVDGSRPALSLIRIEIPTIDEMRNGLGTIRVRAAGAVAAGAGRHRLSLVNNHRPDASVYMVNALLPEDSGVTLVSQSRDPRQRESHFEYDLRPQWPMRLLWLGMGGAVLTGVVVVRDKEKRKTKNE